MKFPAPMIGWSDSVVVLWHQCSSRCSHPSTFWLLPSRSLRSRSCRSSSAPDLRTSAGRIPWMGQSILLSGLERNRGLTVLLKMDNTSRPLTAHHCCKHCRSRSSRASRHYPSCRISNRSGPISTGTSAQTQELRIRQGNESDEGSSN